MTPLRARLEWGQPPSAVRSSEARPLRGKLPCYPREPVPAKPAARNLSWRIVVTVGEKIGKSHLTYAQGVVAEITAMATRSCRRIRPSGQHHPRAVVRHRRHHGRQSVRNSMVHGAESGASLGAYPARSHAALGIVILDLPQDVLRRVCFKGVAQKAWRGRPRPRTACGESAGVAATTPSIRRHSFDLGDQAEAPVETTFSPRCLRNSARNESAESAF